MAEAFCGLKTGSPGSALKVLGFVHSSFPRLMSRGDPWGQVLYRQKRGSLSWAVLPLGPRAATRGTQLSLQTVPPPPGMLLPPCLLWDTLPPLSRSFSFLPVLGGSPWLRLSLVEWASEGQTPPCVNEKGAGGGLAQGHTAGWGGASLGSPVLPPWGCHTAGQGLLPGSSAGLGPPALSSRAGTDVIDVTGHLL